MKEDFKKIISHFKTAKILVVGDLMLDEFIYGEVERISPEAPVPVVAARKRRYMPGGACNVASNIASLGAKVSLVGVVGNDSNGLQLISELKARKIQTQGIFRDKHRHTILKTRIIGGHQQVVRVDWEDTDLIKGLLSKKMAGFISDELKNFDCLIIEDYGKGVITKELLASICFANKQNKIITVDPKEDHFSMYRALKITAITPNRKETENAIRNIKISDSNNKLKIYQDRLVTSNDIDLAAAELLKYLGAKAVLITLGEAGMRLFEARKKPFHIDTVAQEVFDVSGAGDTVVATFTLALAVGAGFQKAAVISNFAAGIVVGKIGVATVSPQELLNSIALKYR
ncbi:MAG: D-glycero-beta-D-manno-heptose-7-phosphate kinase [Candidatus Omnitrophota bacterium]|nr:D-glycero-beta-D-manno-heptose-7-phosphate kinase [Candidatus Omnitrophota bacterium]